MSEPRLKDRVAVITGASRGIGRATAIALAEAGADVLINYHSHGDEAEDVARQVQRLGGRAVTYQGDVSELGVIEAMVQACVDEFGRVDIAVSNAAYSDREPFIDADMDGFHRTVNVTMWGAFYLTYAAARQMKTQTDGGSIVIVSSPHAYIPAPNAMAYNMSKAAIEQMAKTASIEVAQHGIRVNIIQPGWTDTPGERKYADEDTLKRAAAGIPLGRLGSPEEMARGILFLADPDNDYMTGTTLLIDGGISLPWWANRGSAAPA